MKRRNFIRTAAMGTAGIGFYQLYALEPRIDRFSTGKYCVQPSAEIPVIADVDILIAGSTSGGVAAAKSAALSGATVFLAGSLPYLGEDICGTFSNLFERHGNLKSDLGRRLFPSSEPVYPMHVKTILEKELIDHNVNFLYCSFICDVIFGDDDQPSGVIISNRTGRQAILCKSIIDCTPGAYVARLAGGRFTIKMEEGAQTFRFITAGKKTNEKADAKIRELPVSIEINKKKVSILENEISLPLKDFSFSSLANIEQIIRDKTWNPDQVDSADHFNWKSPYRLTSQGSCITKAGKITDIPLSAFMPEGINNIYVLSSCIDAPGETAHMTSDPDNLINLGGLLGRTASGNIKTKKKSLTFSTRPVKGVEYLEDVTGEISETLRSNLGNKKILCESTALPIIGEFDVVVAGGGTAGAPAAISSARNGAKTLVIEYLHGLGGTGTLGLIGRYWYGHREGFTREIDEGVRQMADNSHPRQKKTRNDEWVMDWKMEWYRREIRKAGGIIWFGAMVTGALVKDRRVSGVVVSTPEGRGIVLAKQVIDSTGSADIAIAAGARYEYTGKNTVAVQGAGLPKFDPDDHYNNTDWTFIDDSDVFDVTRVFISGKQKFPSSYDIGKLPQTRERRRINAEFMVSPIDMLNGRRYHDTISYHVSNFDTHGYTVHPYFLIKQPDGGHVKYNVDLPLRSLLPKGLDGIIVTGLGVGAHRDAMPVIRMQPCLQNQGFAVGFLAAKLVKENTTARKIDLKSIQKYLVEIGNLPERVLSDIDEMPVTDLMFAESVKKVKNNFEGIEILFSDMERAKKDLIIALEKSSDEKEKLNLAITLGVLGRENGWEVLVKAVREFEYWDDGWNYTGMGQFGNSLSFLDTIIISLGNTKKEESLPALIAKAEILTTDHKFSHFRAVSVAFETIGSKKAAPVLYKLLNINGFSNHQVLTHVDAVKATVPDSVDVTLRNKVLKELHIARALYRCGDMNGLGRRLIEKYSQDLHGHYFRHASGLLGSPDKKIDLLNIKRNNTL